MEKKLRSTLPETNIAHEKICFFLPNTSEMVDFLWLCWFTGVKPSAIEGTEEIYNPSMVVAIMGISWRQRAGDRNCYICQFTHQNRIGIHDTPKKHQIFTDNHDILHIFICPTSSLCPTRMILPYPPIGFFTSNSASTGHKAQHQRSISSFGESLPILDRTQWCLLN